jgi:hypothetical protein
MSTTSEYPGTRSRRLGTLGNSPSQRARKCVIRDRARDKSNQQRGVVELAYRVVAQWSAQLSGAPTARLTLLRRSRNLAESHRSSLVAACNR